MRESDIQQDPFVTGLKDRLPSHLRESFTTEQLQALKTAFGARKWGQHPVDLRGTLGIWRSRYYFVLLMGRNHRELSRMEQELSNWMRAVFILGFLCFSLLVGLLGLYLLKSALGINLLPNLSLGIWDWFNR